MHLDELNEGWERDQRKVVPFVPPVHRPHGGIKLLGPAPEVIGGDGSKHLVLIQNDDGFAEYNWLMADGSLKRVEDDKEGHMGGICD